MCVETSHSSSHTAAPSKHADVTCLESVSTDVSVSFTGACTAVENPTWKGGRPREDSACAVRLASAAAPYSLSMLVSFTRVSNSYSFMKLAQQAVSYRYVAASYPSIPFHWALLLNVLSCVSQLFHGPSPCLLLLD